MLFQRIKSILRDYFTLTSRERRGAMSLATINFILIGVLLWNNYIFPPEPVPDSWFTPEYFAFEQTLIASELTAHDSIPVVPVGAIAILESTFDPNEISDTDWMAIGLPEKQIKIIRNYLDKGGRFKKPGDLMRIYGIDSAWFEQVASFISIRPPDSITKFPKNLTPQRNQRRIVDLNKADTLQLSELPLIGAGRARMIWKYREKLGGYHHTHQLKEVFTIDSAVFETIRPYVSCSGPLRKFNINADTLNHPYLPRSLVKALKAYRGQHGNFTDTTAVKSTGILTDSTWLKLVPYIGFE